jgi:hypothetical protein
MQPGASVHGAAQKDAHLVILIIYLKIISQIIAYDPPYRHTARMSLQLGCTTNK